MKRYLPSILFLAFLLFLPQIASTPLTRPLFSWFLHKKIPAQITLHSYRFSWLGPQNFQQLEWKRDLFSGDIEDLSINAPFWSFSGPITFKTAHLFYNNEPIETLNGSIEKNTFDLKGKYVTVHGTAQGDLDLLIHHPNLATHLIGHLSSDSFSSLAPITATFSLKTGPLLSETPGTLRLDPGSFSFSLPKLELKGTIDLAQTKYLNGASLSPFLSFLGANPSPTPNVWFAPVDFSLQHNTLTLGRLDFLLADAIHLCLWGAIDLPSTLHLYLGIPADTLAKTFSIRSVPPNYVLKTEVSGTIEHPSINKKSIGTKIAALAAVNKLPAKSLLPSLFARPPIDKDVPAAKYPLPWEEMKN